MVDRVCLGDKFVIEEFTIICKSNLPSTVQQGQFVAFIPTTLLESTRQIGQWIYCKNEELVSLAQGIIPDSIIQKAILKL